MCPKYFEGRKRQVGVCSRQLECTQDEQVVVIGQVKDGRDAFLSDQASLMRRIIVRGRQDMAKVQFSSRTKRRGEGTGTDRENALFHGLKLKSLHKKTGVKTSWAAPCTPPEGVF